MIRTPNFAHMLFSPHRNSFVPGHPAGRHFLRWRPYYNKIVSGRRNSQSLFHVCANYIFVALNMLFSCICFTIFYYLTKNNLYNRKNMKWVIYFALLRHTGINQCRLSRHWVLYQLLFKVLPNTLWLNRENQLFWIKSTLWHCWDRVRFQ